MNQFAYGCPEAHRTGSGDDRKKQSQLNHLAVKKNSSNEIRLRLAVGKGEQLAELVGRLLTLSAS
jgi:hypothetical protein